MGQKSIIKLVTGVIFGPYFAEYVSHLVRFLKGKKSLVFGIALGIYLGVYVCPLIEFLNEKERALALVLGIALGVYFGRCVSPLIEFFKEKKRMQIAGHGESSRSSNIKAGTWVLDSGAQCHVTGDPRLFSSLNMAKKGSWIYGVSGQQLPIRGFGAVQFPYFTLEEVYYVEGLGRNLICLSKFQVTFGYKITFGKATYIEEEATGRRICELRNVDGLYEMDSVPVALDQPPAAEGRA
ncbi:uncharacterized protein [Triticum aestivum]|uniref:uncharacterized protein n=1 Tax=Triticum aestivum TaxID=4565 RepID=UPI001D0124C8|nr:uncharacterized protein LOC123139790 [Triticum aestivum]